MKYLTLLSCLLLIGCTNGIEPETSMCNNGKSPTQTPMFSFAGGVPIIIGFIPTCEE